MYRLIVDITNKLKIETVRKTISIFALKILGIFSSYLLTFLVSNYYGAEGWGTLSICLGVASFAYLFGKFGFDMALLKFSSTLHHSSEEMSILKTIYQKAFKGLLPLCISLTFFLIFISPFLSHLFFKNDNNGIYFILIAFSITPAVLTLVDSEGLRGLGKTSQYVFIQNIAIYLIASVLLSIYNILLGGRDFKSIFIIYLIASIIVFIICRIWWQHSVLSFPTSSSSKVLTFKQIISISYPMFWSNAMFVLINWTDTLMLGVFSTEADVGIYNAAFKISNLVAVPLYVITSIAAPKFATKYASGDYVGLAKIINQSTSIIFVLTLPIFLVIAIFPYYFLQILGASFVAGVPILVILIVGQFFKSFCGSTDYLLQMTGHEKVFQRIILSAMVVNVLLNLILIPNFGSYGAAIANSCTIIYWNLIATYYIKIKLRINALINFKTFNLRAIKEILALNTNNKNE